MSTNYALPSGPPIIMVAVGKQFMDTKEKRAAWAASPLGIEQFDSFDLKSETRAHFSLWAGAVGRGLPQKSFRIVVTIRSRKILIE